jgi:DNA-binding MarR family transcriptional regulator
MPRQDVPRLDADRLQGPPGDPGANQGDSAARLHRLLRYSHIFSAAVREILESRFLEEVSEHTVTLAQFHLLKLIGLNGHHQVGEVAEFLGVSAPAASKNIDRLEALGLVARGSCEEDRRATLLSTSPKGRDLIRRYEDLTRDRLAPVLAQFDTTEIDRLSELLERFSVRLFGREKGGESFCLRCAAYCQADCPIGAVLGNCPYDTIRSRGRVRPPIAKEEVS